MPMNPISAEPEDLLTSDQVMDRLLGDETLRRLAVTCVLRAVRCGNEWRYRKSDLEAWIERQIVSATMPRT